MPRLNYFDRVQRVAHSFGVKHTYRGVNGETLHNDYFVEVFRSGVNKKGQESIRCICRNVKKGMLSIPVGVFLDKVGEEFNDPDIPNGWKDEEYETEDRKKWAMMSFDWEGRLTMPYEKGPRGPLWVRSRIASLLSTGVDNPHYEAHLAQSLLHSQRTVPAWTEGITSISTTSESKRYKPGELVRNNASKSSQYDYYFISSYRSRARMGMFALYRVKRGERRKTAGYHGEVIVSSSISKWGEER